MRTNHSRVLNDLRSYIRLHNRYQSLVARDLGSTRCFGVASIKEKSKTLDIKEDQTGIDNAVWIQVKAARLTHIEFILPAIMIQVSYLQNTPIRLLQKGEEDYRFIDLQHIMCGGMVKEILSQGEALKIVSFMEMVLFWPDFGHPPPPKSSTPPSPTSSPPPHHVISTTPSPPHHDHHQHHLPAIFAVQTPQRVRWFSRSTNRVRLVFLTPQGSTKGVRLVILNSTKGCVRLNGSTKGAFGFLAAAEPPPPPSSPHHRYSSLS
ncbi:hypothetical protein Tco_1136048 [Tanacetum coccineum]